jgi:hypothetical protein
MSICAKNESSFKTKQTHKKARTLHTPQDIN